jgi:hypothetical protein
VPWFDGRNVGFVGGEGETKFCCEMGDVALETDGGWRNGITAELVGAISCEVGSRIKDSMFPGRAGSCEVDSRTTGLGFSREVQDGSMSVGLAKVVEGLIGTFQDHLGRQAKRHRRGAQLVKGQRAEDRRLTERAR